VYENRVLRRIFGPKREEIIRVIKSRSMRCASHVARMGEMIYGYRILVGKSEGKLPLKMSRRTGEDNIKMDLKEAEYEGVDWIHLSEDRNKCQALLNAVMNLRVP
jgi:hypothetical protein